MPTLTRITAAQTTVDAAQNRINAYGLRAQVIGADFDVAGFRGQINPVFLGVSSAKILADDTVLDTYKAKIQMGNIALVANGLTLFI